MLIVKLRRSQRKVLKSTEVCSREGVRERDLFFVFLNSIKAADSYAGWERELGRGTGIELIECMYDRG